MDKLFYRVFYAGFSKTGLVGGSICQAKVQAQIVVK